MYETGDEGPTEILFTEKSIRMGFIRKVYSILMLQLAITTAFICLCVFEQHTNEFVKANSWLVWVAMAFTFIILIVLACCTNVRRNYPMNLILLCFFTLCEAFCLGTVSSLYDADAVAIAAGVTAIVALGLTIFSFQTKWDFTVMGGVLFVFVIILFFFGLFAIIWPSKVMVILYASFGALIFSAYLVFDTQMMMGGKHRYALSPEEYIFAALNLYLDIVNIFLYVLTIVGAVRR